MNATATPVTAATPSRVRRASRAAVPDVVAGAWTRLLRLRPYEIELLWPGAPVPPLGWLLFGLGMLLAALAAWRIQPLLAQRAELAQQHATLELALDKAGAGTPRGGASQRRGAAGDIAPESQAMLDELRRPWHAFFDQIESAALADGGNLHVVQLSIDPRFSTLQVTAEARDLGRIVRFSRRLTGGVPIRSLTLTHYEWRDALGGHVVSASLQGELVLPQPVVDLSLASAEAPR
jgi:hypothetical protein